MPFSGAFKDFLKDGEDMTQKEMMELEEAIQKSKETSRVEIVEQREQIEKPYESDTTGDSSNANQQKSLIPKPKPWTKQSKIETVISKPVMGITFQDLHSPSGRFFKILHHSPVFDLPIPTNLQLQKHTISQRAKLLYDYYTQVDKLQADLAKNSIHRASWPKPIPSSTSWKWGEGNKSEDEFAEQSTVDLYVSRAGRQIKRKIYTEEMEVDSDSEANYSKKTKGDTSDIKITLDTPLASEEKSNKATKTKKDLPRFFGGKKSSRAETLFDHLVHDDDRRKQHEEEIDKFKQTLPTLDDFDEFEIAPSPNIDTFEEGVPKRRVPPPLPIKKGGRGKKSPKLQEGYGSKTEVGGHKRTATTRTANPKGKQKAKSPIMSEDACKVNCPICNKKFYRSEIEDHASNCGDDDEISSEVPNKKVIKCELCDKLFDINTEYEVHVKHCIASKVTDL